MVDGKLSGLYPILAMPFDSDGRIDTEDLAKEVEFAIDSGVDGVGLALGSEILKLTDEERDLATKTIVNQANHRVKVVINTGAPGTRLATTYSQRAQELGADALMAAPPHGISEYPDLIKKYFGYLSKNVSLPIFIQDIETAPVPPSVAAQIAQETEHATYAKMETPPTPNRISDAVRYGKGSLTVFGGYGGYRLLHELKQGSVGTMPHCAIPELFRYVMDQFCLGKEKEAKDRFEKYNGIFTLIGSDLSSFSIVKEILQARGIFKTTHVRQPFIPPGKFPISELHKLLGRLNLRNQQ